MNIAPKSRLDIIDTAQLAQREKRLLKYLLVVAFFVYLQQFGIPWITDTLVGDIVPAEGSVTLAKAKPGALPWRRLKDLAATLQTLRQREPIAERTLGNWQARLDGLIPAAGRAPSRYASVAIEVEVRKLLPDFFRAVVELGVIEAGRTQPLRSQLIELGKCLNIVLDESAPPPQLDYGPRMAAVDPKPHRQLFEFAQTATGTPESKVPSAPGGDAQPALTDPLPAARVEATTPSASITVAVPADSATTIVAPASGAVPASAEASGTTAWPTR